MYRAFILVPVAIGAAAAVGSVYYYDLGSFFSPDAPVASAPSSALPAAIAKTTAPRRQAEATAPAFDIVRIDPNGVSVFAGRAMPNALVTVLRDGQPVATARADENGDWSITTEHRFAAGETRLSVSAKAGEQAAPTLGQSTTLTIAGNTRVAAASAATGATTDLERAVAAARSGNAVQPASIPIPVRFVYNEAKFTEEGRKAVGLLAEYLKLQRLKTVTLTGHADERGSDQYNMELSRQRLQSVARYLHEHGYRGKLVLVPKGRSEPFTGVDRRVLPREEAFQLDRRVELHLTR